MDFVGSLIDSIIILFIWAIVLTEILSICMILRAKSIEIMAKVSSTISSILVIIFIFIMYRPAEILMPYARNVIGAILGL